MSLFWRDRVADSVIADFIVTLDPLFDAPGAQLLREFCALDVLVRDEVVGCYENLRRIEDFVYPQFPEHLHSRRCRDVMANDQVEFRIDDFTRHDLLASAMGGKNLFGNGHSHMKSLRKMLDVVC